MGLKIEIKNFPNVGYYTIKLEDGSCICYKNRPIEGNREGTFDTLQEAKNYCYEKLKEKVNIFLKRKRK